jgi:arginine/lysine/ornithine decarboxylase
MDERRKTEENTLQEALGTYERDDCARFHMPGHKGRGLAGFWRDELVKWDVTEISPTDNLHAPHGAILTAEQEMAKAYGAKASFYVVNGSTNAVQAMILALSEDDKLLLSRDCHHSAASGAALRGIETETILPRFDEETKLPGMVTPEDLESELERTRATAVLITSPNAYGLCADAAGLAKVAHSHGALLLVDGAHGAHFPFSDALPHGLGGVADLFAHSQHKTMDALTQAASLHLGECRIGEHQVRRALAMTETTSPSYLLMASLDWSVYMAKRRDWTAQVARIAALEPKIEAIDGLIVPKTPERCGVFERDRTRLVIDVGGRGLSGYEAQAHLEQNGVYIEMADARRLVLITTPNDEAGWYTRLLSALETLPVKETAEGKSHPVPLRYGHHEKATSFRDAAFGALEQVRLEDAAGRVASEPIGVYPPGIALVMPGEVISKQDVESLLRERALGGALFGARGGMAFVTEKR